MPPFDWSPYFGSYTMPDLLAQAAIGAGVLVPLLLFRMGYKTGADLLVTFVKSALR